ncbi:MAG: hypothetical protein U0R26_08815 [Solirubrobacterales bacterium]
MEEVEEAIRPGGLGKQKAPRIQAILEQLGEHPDLDWTRRRRGRSLRVLSLPEVGRKTAACVLIFTWGIPEIPVDVRAPRRRPSGLFPPGPLSAGPRRNPGLVDPEDAYELHMNLIRHGRTLCRPKPAAGVRAAARMPLVRAREHGAKERDRR